MLFVDDLKPLNIEAARRAGLQAVLARGVAEAEQALAAAGVRGAVLTSNPTLASELLRGGDSFPEGRVAVEQPGRASTVLFREVLRAKPAASPK